MFVKNYIKQIIVLVFFSKNVAGQSSSDSLKNRSVRLSAEVGVLYGQGVGTYYAYYQTGVKNVLTDYGCTVGAGIIVKRVIYFGARANFEIIDGKGIFPLSIDLNPIVYNRKVRVVLNLNGGYGIGNTPPNTLYNPFYSSTLKTNLMVGSTVSFSMKKQYYVFFRVFYCKRGFESESVTLGGNSYKSGDYLNFAGVGIGVSFN